MLIPKFVRIAIEKGKLFKRLITKLNFVRDLYQVLIRISDIH